MVEKTNSVRKCEACGDMTQYRVKLTGIFVCCEWECLCPNLPQLGTVLLNESK